MSGIEALGPYWQKIVRGRGFQVQAVAREPRRAAIDRVEGAVQRLGGDVLDFTALSDLSLNLIVELRASAAVALVDELAALGWPVELRLERGPLGALGEARLEGTVQLTFPEGEGRLSHPQPAVPG